MAEKRNESAKRRNEPGSSVDYVVDENASPLDVPDDSIIRSARDDEATLGATGPTNWWRYGLVALGIVVLILLLLQLFGGAPGTDVQTGTPVAEPEVTEPAPDQM
jgi:hypothetical protein